MSTAFYDSSTEDDNYDFISDAEILDHTSQQNEVNSLNKDDDSNNLSDGTLSTIASFVSDSQSN